MQQAQKKLLQMNILVKLLCVVCGTTVFADKHALKEKTAESLCQFSGAAKAAAKTIATKMASAQSRLEEYRKLQMSLTLLAATKPCYSQACQLLATYAAYKAEQVNIVTRTLASRGALAAGASACSACRIDELFFTLHDPVGVSSRTSKTCIDPTSGDSYFANTKNCDFFTSTLNNRVSEAISAGTLTAGGGVITITKGAEQADGGLATDENKVAHVAEAIRQTDKIKTAMAQGLPPPLGTATEITEFLNGQAETELAEIDKIISGAAEAKDQTKMKATIDTVFGKKADDGTRPFTKLLTTEAYSYKQDGVNKKVKLLELTETETTKQAVAKIMILNKQAADKTECQAAVITKSKPEEVCNAIEDTTTCNNEKQCSYDDSKETGKKCTYNASKATENGVPATQTQTVGGAGTNEKCKGKLEDACKKAPDCKWDGKECKDSSFLINRKFSLTAVTFMSLIGI